MSDSTATPAPEAGIAAQVEDAGPCLKKIRVTVPPERVREELDRTFLEVIRRSTSPASAVERSRYVKIPLASKAGRI